MNEANAATPETPVVRKPKAKKPKAVKAKAKATKAAPVERNGDRVGKSILTILRVLAKAKPGACLTRREIGARAEKAGYKASGGRIPDEAGNYAAVVELKLTRLREIEGERTYEITAAGRKALAEAGE